MYNLRFVSIILIFAMNGTLQPLSIRKKYFEITSKISVIILIKTDFVPLEMHMPSAKGSTALM